VIVVDASALVDVLAGEGRATERQADEDLVAPHLIDAEVGSALRRMVAQGVIDVAVADGAIADLQALEIERFDLGLLLWRAWELRDNLSFHDALYVALAEALDAPLVTLDARLAGASGVAATVEVIRGVQWR
jgi:predicted nucleic acid-binding protein